VRRDYARKVERLAELRTPGLTRAFATIPREAFVGPGPWQILKPQSDDGYVETPDDDPTHLYDNVLVALDRRRSLNNGEPVSLARWLDLLGLEPGASFAHIGCGVGYYTAIAFEATRPDGRGLALEASPELARRAATALAAYPGLEVRAGSGFADGDGPFDAIFVNAGATHVVPGWLAHLADGGRMLLPLTASIAGGEIGAGRVLRIVRRGAGLEAAFVSFAAIFHCIGARSDDREQALREAYREGDADRVRSLRLDPHEPDDQCWLHASDSCLSYAPPPEG
jgi:protein-L-isoaspartate(D-aspartate) O-methyltransferase